MPDITPRTNTELFGHEDAEAMLRREFAAGTLAHGWIISGPRGIGKATLAYRFAKTLLGANSEIRIAANSHADLLVIEPAYDEKKEELAREISVEQAREISKFLSLTPGEGQWRVVIIDSADALNINAANAILKILEEPPSQSVILLVSHNQGKLLPTIRSRCHQLKLKPLRGEAFDRVMRHIAPDIDENELAVLAPLSGNAPGVAIEMHEQEATEIYNQILDLLLPLPGIDTGKLHAFADRIATKQVHANWQLLMRLMLSLIERISRQAAGMAYEPVSDVEETVIRKAVALQPSVVWAMKWQQCADQFSLAESRHLDYKHVIITFFHSIASKEGLQIVAA
jgi:DNA polymerase-3 subunit delta'